MFVAHGTCTGIWPATWIVRSTDPRGLRAEIAPARVRGAPDAMSGPLPPRAQRARRRLELTTAGAPAIVVAVVAAIAIAMAAWLR